MQTSTSSCARSTLSGSNLASDEKVRIRRAVGRQSRALEELREVVVRVRDVTKRDMGAIMAIGDEMCRNADCKAKVNRRKES